MRQKDNNKYPVGQPELSDDYKAFDKIDVLNTIKDFPVYLAEIQAKHPDWSKTYRPQGWSAAQVVHHCADSHMNALIRLKLALTENNPTIKPYDEKSWATLSDYTIDHISYSIALLSALHKKWFHLLSSLSKAQWQRSYYHPATAKKVFLFNQAEEYAWHCRHHLAHINLCFQ